MRSIRSAAKQFSDGRTRVAASGVILLISQSLADNSDAAEQAVAEGVKLAADDELDAAIGSFSKAIQGMPDMYEAYALRGMARTRLKQFVAAQDDLTRARELAPDDTLVQAAQIALRLEMNQPESLHEYTYDARFCAREHYRLRGERSMVANSFQQAVDCFSKALAANKDLEHGPELQLLVRRGFAWESLGDYQGANADYRAAKNVYDDIAKFDGLLLPA